MPSGPMRKARRAEKFGHPLPENAELKSDAQTTTEEKPVEVEKSPEIEPVAEKSPGSGAWPTMVSRGNVRRPSGLMPIAETRLLLRAANWQQKNRVPLEMAVDDDGNLVTATETRIDGAEEIYINAIQAMRSDDERLRAAGLRAGVQLLKSVQSDDHAKLRAEISPTVINQKILVDQRQDNRKVYLMLPQNNRDPNSLLPVSDSNP